MTPNEIIILAQILEAYIADINYVARPGKEQTGGIIKTLEGTVTLLASLARYVRVVEKRLAALEQGASEQGDTSEYQGITTGGIMK